MMRILIPKDEDVNSYDDAESGYWEWSLGEEEEEILRAESARRDE